MVALNRVVRMVMLQFSFSNPAAIPASVKRLDRETEEEHAECVERKNHPSGVMAIEPTAKCSLVEFLAELEAAGYEMVDAFYKKRIYIKDPLDKKKYRVYHTVRYLFARREFVELSDEFKRARDGILVDLMTICEEALWRVRLFSNPFFKNGEEVSGELVLSVNLEAREPLFRPDGGPVTVWHRDENGKRVGVAPRPLKADYRLRIVGDTVTLVMA